jgi:hypothetical protein
VDLLTPSGSSVTTAAAGKAVRVRPWAAQRPFGGVDNSRFAASMGTVGRGAGRIRCSHRHYSAHMGMGVVVFGEGAQRFWLGARGGGEKLSMVMVVIGTLG